MKKILLFLLCVVVMQTATADTEVVLSLLKKMANAEKTLTYEGDLVYLHGPKVETMHIVHAVDQKGERKRVMSKSGDDKEVVMDAQHLFAVMPDAGKILVEKRRPGQQGQVQFANLYEANENYEYKLQGKERIAGKNCQVVSIYPKDNFRFGYRFSIEEESGLLLKALTQDRAGQIHEQMMYTSVAFPETIAPEKFTATLQKDEYQWQESVNATEEGVELPQYKSVWRLQDLPPGFQQVESSQRFIPGTPGPVEHFVLSDKLATLSLFISKIEQSNVPLEEGAGRSGSLNIYSVITDNHHITVVGAVPKNTIEYIARSLRRDP